MFEFFFGLEVIGVFVVILSALIILSMFPFSIITKSTEKRQLAVVLIVASIIIGTISFFTGGSKAIDAYSLDKETDSISKEQTDNYKINEEFLLTALQDQYDITHISLERMPYSEEYEEYLGEGAARFDGRMIEFSLSVGLDSELTLAPYSEQYSEKDLLK